jgi:hypothetical protein
MTTQADAIAKIALSVEWDLTDPAVTTKRFLKALNQAYIAGFEAGSAAANQNHLRMQDLLLKAFTP